MVGEGDKEKKKFTRKSAQENVHARQKGIQKERGSIKNLKKGRNLEGRTRLRERQFGSPMDKRIEERVTGEENRKKLVNLAFINSDWGGNWEGLQGEELGDRD